MKDLYFGSELIVQITEDFNHKMKKEPCQEEDVPEEVVDQEEEDSS